MKPVFTKKITVIILSFSLAMLVAGTIITYLDIKRLISTNSRVVQIHKVIEQLNDVVLGIIAMRDATLDYLDQQNDDRYQRYEHVKIASQSNLQTLRQLLAQNLDQQAALANLLPVYSTYIKKLDLVMAQPTQALDRAQVTAEVKAQALEAEKITSNMSDIEFAKLAQHNAYVTRSSQDINMTFILVGFLSNFLLLLCFLLLNRQEKLHHQALSEKNRDLALSNVRLQEINRLKGEFLANMSHELRTPLNAVIGFTQLISNGDAGDINDEQRELSTLVLTNAQELLTMINRILDLSKIDSGIVELHPENIHLQKTFADVIQSLNKSLVQRNIRIVQHIQDVTDVYLDPMRFNQILFNYLSNAIKFSPKGGEVTILVGAAEPGFFKMAVVDHGIGIKAEDLNKLFVEFQQVDGSASKAYGGVGMGLALTKKIVVAMGGRVGVESRLNEGSVFYTILPIKQSV